ncbi:PepSY-associated TM helix domain-containing protein [Herbaspirillum sp. RTI4]|uniref:PepSY-associated TM helix domain-containing protein n=1 Tax=Herbaspirillum sp. RTI4 TaxID=3048640 RepID=UPI002AB4A001|nr:PepSY-associated TM helix domain-containing protein [Herbaspirillum sp. RTI4]MDY7576868.1 PepSY-associated TM helix domain-containing protein [Herbaspirillum sp. RTI4]MEA9982525.1 PepSY-associated TM helix domain-containing protein [Herbaspirillum sp. RTI4]
MTPHATSPDLRGQQRRAFWLRHLHQWHWISSALCLLAMLLFAVTGFTLNHATQIESKARVENRKEQLPAPLREEIARSGHADKDPLPANLRVWLEQDFAIRVNSQNVEWSPEEIYLALPRPGGDAWLRIDRASGEVEYETTDRGWISYFNDLHKGRNTGSVWSWFIDLFAGACLVFCLTGLFLLQLHGGNRPATWPMVAFGLVLPLLLVILFIH